MSQFKIEKKDDGGQVKISISGHIDEDASFASMSLKDLASVTIDLNQVKAINSCGIREWIKWIQSSPSSSKIVFQNCPKVIVDQINMVSGFLPNHAEVESFFVPYFSEESGTEKMILFTKGTHFKGQQVLPPVDISDETGAVMEMDVIEAKYFKFITK